MNVCTSYLKHNQSNMFFFNFLLYSPFYDTLTQHGEWAIFDWTVLEVKTQERMSLEQTKPTTYTHIPVEVK